MSEREEAIWEHTKYKGYLRCSNCKLPVTAERLAYWKWNFCPVCGCKMKRDGE